MTEKAHQYFRWYHMLVDGAASMGQLEDTTLAVTRALKLGESAVNRLPPSVYFRMRDTFPKDVMLIDQMYNMDGFQLVSPRVQAFLRDQALPGLELPPVSIQDHRGRVVATDYAIVHPTRVVDCIDQKLSVFKWNVMAPNTMAPVSRMVLDPATLGPDDRLIRPRYVANYILVRDDLAALIMNQGFQGPYMVPGAN